MVKKAFLKQAYIMKKSSKYYKAIVILLLFTGIFGEKVHAQNSETKPETGPTRWEESIQKFEKMDQENPPEEGLILFVGSSSIGIWNDVQDYFPDSKVLNRGFGGSQFSDMLYYADRVIFPYKPSKIFIYEGDNDVASGDKPKAIMKEAKQLRKMIERELPGVPVVFISAKPSVLRWNIKEDYEDFNKRLEKYSKRKKNTMFADVWTAMLDEEGKVYEHIFLEDNLHMNAEGYKIWKSVLDPYIEEDRKN